jgi:hypothetical protein
MKNVRRPKLDDRTDEALQAMLSMRNEPGWVGTFTRAQAEGAIPNGTVVIKTLCDPGDTHPAGTPGKVLGSIRALPGMEKQFPGVEYMYWVEWQPHPLCAVVVVSTKIRPL